MAGPVDLLVNDAAVSVAAPVEDRPAGVALAMLDSREVLKLVERWALLGGPPGWSPAHPGEVEAQPAAAMSRD